MKKKVHKWALGLIVLPFVVVIVWILWSTFSYKAPAQHQSKGFNTQLPAAKLSKDSALDKLSFYSAAKEDSIHYADMLQLDPYRSKQEAYECPQLDVPIPSFYSTPKRSVAIESEPTSFSFQQHKIASAWEEKDTTLEIVQQLLQQLASLQQEKDSMPIMGETKATVLTTEPEDFFGARSAKIPSSFYGLQQPPPVNRRWMASLSDQIVQNGAVIKMQLLEDLLLSDCVLKAGSMIYGIASLQSERMQIEIRSVSCVDRIVQTHLQVYDMDGIKGMSVPVTQSKELLSNAVDPAMQSFDLPIGYGSIPNKVALAGMQTAKQLIAKKAKAIRIHVSSGYRVYLYHKE